MLRAPLRNEKGQSIIIIAIILVVLIALIALVIDVGNAYAQKRIVQNAVDAAALAATGELVSPSATFASIISVGREYVGLNGAEPDTTRIWLTDVNGNKLHDNPITPSSSAPPREIDGVQVGGVYLTAGKDFTTFFAGVVGANLLAASAHSAGYISPGGACAFEPTGGIGLFPMTISVDLFGPDDGTPVEGKSYRVWDKATTAYGNFGWVTWDNDPSEQTLVDNMHDASRSGPWAVGDMLPGGPGVQNSRNVRNELDARLDIYEDDRPPEVIIPIHDYTEGTGNNLSYHIVGFAIFHLTDYNFKGSDKWVEGYFVKETIPGATSGGCTYFLAKAPPSLHIPVGVARVVEGTVSVAKLVPEKRSGDSARLPVDVVNVMDVSGSMSDSWGSSGLREQKLITAKRVLAGDGTGPEGGFKRSGTRYVACDPADSDCTPCSSDPADQNTWFDNVTRKEQLDVCMKGINNYLQPPEDQLGLSIYPGRTSNGNRYTMTCSRSSTRTYYFGALKNSLTEDVQAVNTQVDAMSPEGWTPMVDGTRLGREALFNPQLHRPKNAPVLIVATDGMVNVSLDGKVTGWNEPRSTGITGCNALPEIQSVDQANLAKQEGAIVFTIAIGNGVRADVLEEMATAPAYDPNPYDDKNEGHFFMASDPRELATIYDAIAKRVGNIGDECIAKQVPAVPEGATVELWKKSKLAKDEDGNALQSRVGASGRFAFTKVPAGLYEIHATWTDNNGVVYDVQTESLGGQEMVDPEYATVEVPEGTGTQHKDVYLKTDQIPTCD